MPSKTSSSGSGSVVASRVNFNDLSKEENLKTNTSKMAEDLPKKPSSRNPLAITGFENIEKDNEDRMSVVYTLANMMTSSDRTKQCRELLLWSCKPEVNHMLRTSNFLSLIVSFIHDPCRDIRQFKFDAAEKEIWQNGRKTLLNLIEFQISLNDQRELELKIFSQIEYLRNYVAFFQQWKDDHEDWAIETFNSGERKFASFALEVLSSMSQNSRHRSIMLQFGCLQALAECFILEKFCHENLMKISGLDQTTVDHHQRRRRQNDRQCFLHTVCVILTDLTYQCSVENKEILCQYPSFLDYLMQQIGDENMEPKQGFCSLLRNLSLKWTSSLYGILHNADVCRRLTLSTVKLYYQGVKDGERMESHRHCLTLMLGALWNLTSNAQTTNRHACETILNAGDQDVSHMISNGLISTSKSTSLVVLIQLLHETAKFDCTQPVWGNDTLSICEHTSGILRDVSKYAVCHPEHRRTMRLLNLTELLVSKLLISPSITVVNHACAILYNWMVSIRCNGDGNRSLDQHGQGDVSLGTVEDDKYRLLQLNVLERLQPLTHSKHTTIADYATDIIHMLTSTSPCSSSITATATMTTTTTTDRQHACSMKMVQRCMSRDPTDVATATATATTTAVVVDRRDTDFLTDNQQQQQRHCCSCYVNEQNDGISSFHHRPVLSIRSTTQNTTRTRMHCQAPTTTMDGSITVTDSSFIASRRRLSDMKHDSGNYALNRTHILSNHHASSLPRYFGSARATNHRHHHEEADDDKPMPYADEGSIGSTTTTTTTTTSANSTNVVNRSVTPLQPQQGDAVHFSSSLSHHEQHECEMSKNLHGSSSSGMVQLDQGQGGQTGGLPTPMMYSRRSSFQSLDSCDQQSIRSTVCSEHSQLPTGLQTPSELPDSPTQTMAFRRARHCRQTIITQPTSQQSPNGQTNDEETVDQNLLLETNSVLSDFVRTFNVGPENMNQFPKPASTMSSFSSLTIDPETKIKPCKPKPANFSINFQTENSSVCNGYVGTRINTTPQAEASDGDDLADLIESLMPKPSPNSRIGDTMRFATMFYQQKQKNKTAVASGLKNTTTTNSYSAQSSANLPCALKAENGEKISKKDDQIIRDCSDKKQQRTDVEECIYGALPKPINRDKNTNAQLSKMLVGQYDCGTQSPKIVGQLENGNGLKMKYQKSTLQSPPEKSPQKKGSLQTKKLTGTATNV